MVSKKLDNWIFVGTVVVGLPCLLFAIYTWGQQDIPIAGILGTALCQFLYETHDEIHVFKQLIAWGFPSILFELVNHHNVIPIFTFFGILPRNWVAVTALSYPPLKVAVAIGALGWKGSLDACK